MTEPQQDLHSQEWQILHQEHERYDRYSLLIKLAAVIVCLLALGLSLHIFLGIVFILVLWLQEGIWRTVQARTGERLLIVEELIKDPSDQAAMQFHTRWEETRPGAVGLVKEYLRNAIRPTVAYPYVILLGVEIVACLYFSC